MKGATDVYQNRVIAPCNFVTASINQSLIWLAHVIAIFLGDKDKKIHVANMEIKKHWSLPESLGINSLLNVYFSRMVIIDCTIYEVIRCKTVWWKITKRVSHNIIQTWGTIESLRDRIDHNIIELISRECCIYATVNCVTIGSYNGLSPIRSQATI